MSLVSMARVLFTAAFVSLMAASCARGGPAEEPKSPSPAPAPSAEAPQKTKVGVMEGSIVFVDCPDKLDLREAERTINQLVEPCQSVPGGHARFRATLAPRGRIEIAAADGSSEGVIPICVLKHRLTHKVRVRKPCQLDVQIEERKISGH
jgi:hypothetical protein